MRCTSLLLLAIALGGCAGHGGPEVPYGEPGRPKPRPVNPFEPTGEERRLAVALAEEAIAARELRGEGPIFVVEVTVERDKARELAGEPGRLLAVTHYRYDGDLAIRSWIDLAAREVTRVETIPHLATPLAPEELARARDLALADPQVCERLGPACARSYEGSGAIVAIEPLVLATASREDPLFGHRVVRLLFKTARGYLRDPIVHVDLTREEVLISAPEEPNDEPYP